MTRPPLRALGWCPNALGIAVTITLGVVPDARDWLLDHAGLGWLLVLLLAVATAIVAQIAYFQSNTQTFVAAALARARRAVSSVASALDRCG